MKGIMKANELAYDLDFNKIIKAFKKNDTRADQLLMLSINDPIITGKINRKESQKDNDHEEFLFDELLSFEENDLGVNQNEAENRMKIKLEDEENAHKLRLQKRKEKAEQRIKLEKEEKEKADLKLQRIKNERLAIEERKKFELEEKSKKEKEDLEKQINIENSLIIQAFFNNQNDIDNIQDKIISQNDDSQQFPNTELDETQLAILRLNEYIKEKELQKAKEKSDYSKFVYLRLKSIQVKETAKKKNKTEIQMIKSTEQEEQLKEEITQIPKDKKIKSIEENRLFRKNMDLALKDREKIARDY